MQQQARVAALVGASCLLASDANADMVVDTVVNNYRQSGMSPPDPQNCSSKPKSIVSEDGASESLARVHVVYSSDAKLSSLRLLLESMLSLSTRLANPSLCTIHLIVTKNDMRMVRGLVECFKRELAVRLPASSLGPEVEMHVTNSFQMNVSDPRRKDISQNTFFRYYVHRYLTKAPRVIALDTDTVIRADLTPLYQMRMRHPIAARASHWSMSHIKEMFNLGDAIRNPDALAFNAGVLVYDLSKWRSDAFTRELEAWTPLTSEFLLDNTPLNIVFHDKYDELDWSWHVGHLGWAFVKPRCFNRARILHWNGPMKYLGRDRRYRHLVEELSPQFHCQVLL